MGQIAVLSRYKRVLSVRNFRALWLGQLVSVIGDAFHDIAIPILVFQRTGTATSVAIVVLCQWLPMLVVGPLGGILADRRDRRRIMLLTDLLRAGLVLFVPFAPKVAVIYLITFLLNSCDQLFQPSLFGLVPRLVGRKQLLDANALSLSTRTAADVGGPGLAGLMLSWLGLRAAFFINALSFTFSAAMIAKINPSLENSGTKKRLGLREMGEDFRTGWRFIKTNKPVLFSTTLFMVIQFFGMPSGTLGAVLLMGPLQVDAAGLGFVSSAFGLGKLLGSIFAPDLDRRFNRAAVIVNSTLISGLLTCLLATSPSLLYFMVVSGGTAFLGGVTSTLNPTIRQENTPNHLLGRVAGLYGAASMSLALISIGLSGPAADFFGVRNVLFVSGIGSTVVGLLGRFWPGFGYTKDLYAQQKQVAG